MGTRATHQHHHDDRTPTPHVWIPLASGREQEERHARIRRVLEETPQSHAHTPTGLSLRSMREATLVGRCSGAAQRSDEGSLRKLTPCASGPRPMTMQPTMSATAAKPPIEGVREVLAEHRLERRHDTGAQHPELVREPGQEAAQVRGRQFVHVRWQDAPRALDEELHQESAGHNQRGARCGDPQRDDDQRARARRRSSRVGGRTSPTREPMTIPPMIAPTMDSMVVSATWLEVKCRCCCRNVGYRSCVPCEMNPIAVRSSTRYRKRRHAAGMDRT